jgi:Ca-activated chloride channel homolog
MSRKRSHSVFKCLPPILLATCLLFPLWASAQRGVNHDIRSGNNAYERSDFTKAESKYRDALDKNKNHLHANFNLGAALYRQNRFEEAATYYRNLLQSPLDSATHNAAAYNYGNAMLQQYLNADPDETPEKNQFLQQATKAYMDALLHNPHDDDARHNLSVALKLRHESPPPNQQQQNEQFQHDNQKQEQLLPESTVKEDEIKQHQPEHQKGMMNREDAERILNAIREKEMQTAEQINARERKRMERGREFNW